MKLLSFLSVWILLASVSLCQEAPPKTEPPARFALPTVATPQGSPDTTSASKVDHILQAAKHLEEAGLTEEAAEYRRRAGKDREAVEARIRQLEREIDDLRGLSSAGVQILAELKIIEIASDELRALGLGEALLGAHLPTLPENVPANSICGVLNSDAPVFAKLKAVCDGRRAKVIAEPKMVTVSGRKAELNIGGDVLIRTPTEDGKMKTEQKFVGTRWTLLPMVTPGGKLRLQMRTSVSSLDPDKIDSAVPSVPSPLRRFELEATLEMLKGQTVVTGGLIRAGAKSNDEELMTLTLVTARVVSPMADSGQYAPRPVPASQARRPLPPTVPR